MIVSFSVSNFRSFLSEETLSLVASKKLDGSHQEHAVPIPDSDEKVLRAAVLYGANGAGKSNVFKAFQYLKSLATKTRNRNSGTGRERFRLAETADLPSTFDLQFIVGGKLYRFGLKVNDERIMEEWLVRVNGGREHPIYERSTDETGNVTVDAQGLKDAGKKLQSLATVGGPQNQSFLSTVLATLEGEDQGEELRNVLAWFNTGLRLVAPDAPLRSLSWLLLIDPHFNDFANRFLKSCSTGVDYLQVAKTEITEDTSLGLGSSFPDDVAWRATEAENYENPGAHSFLFKLSDGREVLMEGTNEIRYYRTSVQAAHEQGSGKIVPFELSEESDGTQRLLNLTPVLHHLHSGDGCYVIDELERSLHPNLVIKFLEFFLKSPAKNHGQMIVTTHESNLLDLDLLRRDEIWFAEKDQESATHLYSLADFKVRTDLDIQKHYLQGRFGAIPFLGNLDQLIDEQTAKPE
jgi:uncharacterized protein